MDLNDRNLEIAAVIRGALLRTDTDAGEYGYVCDLDPLDRTLIDGRFDLVRVARHVCGHLAKAEKN